MKIDLCKLFGVEEGEEFKLSKSDLTHRINNNKLEVLYEGLWGYTAIAFNKVATSEIIKLPKKKEFSQETLNFFKCIDKKWKYIAKDENNFVAVYEEKPEKKDGYWDFNWEFDWSRLTFFNQSLFDQILWEDEEPIYIDDYVER